MFSTTFTSSYASSYLLASYFCGTLRIMTKKALTITEFARLGGKARAKTLTPEERQKIARKGGEARQAKAKAKKGGK